MKLYKSKKLLNIDNNPKTVKGQSQKVMTAILYFAPAWESGFNTCPFADDCAKTCLNFAGRGQMNSVQLGRINKTRWYFLERKTFMAQLHNEIKDILIDVKLKGLSPHLELTG